MRTRITRNPNVHVTLGSDSWFLGKKLPCPVCGEGMALRVARTQKPYCHCDPCGLQLFVRGKDGIQRLKDLLASGFQVPGIGRATRLLDQLQRIKDERERLENRRGLLFRDKDLEQAIRILDRDIKMTRKRLTECADDHQQQGRN